MRLIFGIIIAN